MISVRQVTKTFVARGREVPALLPTNLDIPAGAFVSFVGPSGCGKSTLLNMIAGIIPPSGGVIEHGGRVVNGINTHVGYMTQADSLLPWRTTEQNVGFPLVLRGQGKAEIESRVAKMLDMVGLSNFRQQFPSELSGGMRKRVALAQVLAYDPETLLMDEPFGALDAQLKLVMQAELARIWEETRKTIVFVTHDLAEAIALSDHVVIFSGRPGRIKAIKQIDLPRPRDVFKLQFDPAFREYYNELWDALAPEIGVGAVRS